MRRSTPARLLALTLVTATAHADEGDSSLSAPTPIEQAGVPAPPSADEPEAEELLQVPDRQHAPPIATAQPLPREADLIAQARREGGRLTIQRGDREQTLTIDAVLQEKLTGILKSYQTPYAAVVALEPATGRVLALAEHSEADATMRGLCTKAIYPAASIFKVVTAAALLEAGVSPEATECYHGGKRRLTEKLLADSSRDAACLPLGAALALSTNVIFAKLTHKNLSAEKLAATARALGFNRPIPFPIPTEVSLAAIPEDTFGLSTTGAGFGDVYLSPLHGALIAAAAANRGVWRAPLLFESDEPKEEGTRVLAEDVADALNGMLERTITSGTARRTFRERGFRVEGAAGKTGHLADRNPYRDYSWFIGFAPKERPKVAVAAVIVNDALWRIRATWLGREALRLSLQGR